MSLVKILKPDFEFSDERGSLRQLVHDGWNQFNVITSVAGSLRGDHYHKNNNEAFYIIEGELKLILKQNDTVETYIFKNGDFFGIEPFVVHSFEFLRDTVLVSMYDNGVEEAQGKDIYTE